MQQNYFLKSVDKRLWLSIMCCITLPDKNEMSTKEMKAMNRTVRGKEEIMQSVDQKIAALPEDVQTAVAVFAEGLMAGMQIGQKSA